MHLWFCVIVQFSELHRSFIMQRRSDGSTWESLWFHSGERDFCTCHTADYLSHV